MLRENASDLAAFLTVARERSFTRAAAKLGISQSALSQTVRNLEERLKVRLLTRTTRSVSPTEAGERLLRTVGPHLDAVETELAALGETLDQPAGNFRITAIEHAAETILLPGIAKVVGEHPDIHVEVVVDYGLTDIVSHRFDAGVRAGEDIAKDMIAVRVGPDMRMVVVGAPSYIAMRGTPRIPQELVGHSCISLRLQTSGGLYAWEFEKDGRPVNVRVEGGLVFNTPRLILNAARMGLGLAFVPSDQAGPLIESGELVQILDDWCPSFPGYHLYYPSRRQASPAFRLLVEGLRYKGR
ncbi:putative transcriptional regulator [Methylorubrum extorquens DM4]|uniref:Transcriptional regulator n=1 Tax=Methylorubrum extorquens (strain DSM 6343 / CIP 106787 / DM4) TaxID=661410 RepID=C7C976_METED|nr:LysR family transcriptional regulator [Methylorubrum extorquens]CAX22042.1 putative transcriptional regulator [Methylorubrum extorquens DM4]